ncbi:hypothetical protein Tco_0705628 [Tanacetum coccineum]|uniref:Uncharacterized protein n=1 Tax=Tanacetum coccineum TaxID=301880 RepID=A0ABQ4Y6M7_9ASTR
MSYCSTTVEVLVYKGLRLVEVGACASFVRHFKGCVSYVRVMPKLIIAIHLLFASFESITAHRNCLKGKDGEHVRCSWVLVGGKICFEVTGKEFGGLSLLVPQGNMVDCKLGPCGDIESALEFIKQWSWALVDCGLAAVDCRRLRHDLSGFGFDFFSFLITHPFSCPFLTIISSFVDSRLESIEQFLNNFANHPNETDMNDLESNDELVDTPLVSPFPHSNNDSDDGEVLNELYEYENVGMLRREREINSFDGDDLAF